MQQQRAKLTKGGIMFGNGFGAGRGTRDAVGWAVVEIYFHHYPPPPHDRLSYGAKLRQLLYIMDGRGDDVGGYNEKIGRIQSTERERVQSAIRQRMMRHD